MTRRLARRQQQGGETPQNNASKQLAIVNPTADAEAKAAAEAEAKAAAEAEAEAKAAEAEAEAKAAEAEAKAAEAEANAAAKAAAKPAAEAATKPNTSSTLTTFMTKVEVKDDAEKTLDNIRDALSALVYNVLDTRFNKKKNLKPLVQDSSSQSALVAVGDKAILIPQDYISHVKTLSTAESEQTFFQDLMKLYLNTIKEYVMKKNENVSSGSAEQ